MVSAELTTFGKTIIAIAIVEDHAPGYPPAHHNPLTEPLILTRQLQLEDCSRVITGASPTMDSRKYGGRKMKTYGKKTTTNSYFHPIFLGASSQQIEHGVVKANVLGKTEEANCGKLRSTPSDAATFVPESPQSSATLPTRHEERLSPREDDTPDTRLDTAFRELSLDHGGDTAGPKPRSSPVLRPRSHNVQPIAPSSSAEKTETNPRPTPARPNITSSVAGKSLRTTNSQGPPAKPKHGSVIDRVDQHQPGPQTLSYDPTVESPVRVKRTTRSQLNRPDQHSHVRPLLEFATDVSDRRSPGDFQKWADELDEHLEVEKIAEASYGEVYKLRAKNHAAASRSDVAHESVLKVLPLKPRVIPRTARTDHMSAVDDVLVEARTLMRMSVIPGFTNLRDIRVMQGRFPKQFVRAWKAYLQDGAESYFPDPSKPRAYPKSQLWVVIEMENAGKDLERFPLRSAVQTWDIFWSVALAIAKGEDLARFEVCLCSHPTLHVTILTGSLSTAICT